MYAKSLLQSRAWKEWKKDVEIRVLYDIMVVCENPDAQQKLAALHRLLKYVRIPSFLRRDISRAVQGAAGSEIFRRARGEIALLPNLCSISEDIRTTSALIVLIAVDGREPGDAAEILKVCASSVPHDSQIIAGNRVFGCLLVVDKDVEQVLAKGRTASVEGSCASAGGEELGERGISSPLTLLNVQRVCMHDQSLRVLRQTGNSSRSFGPGGDGNLKHLISQLIQIAPKVSEFAQMNVKYCIARLKSL
eukprot:699929-Hanusia_phi.AAC.2